MTTNEFSELMARSELKARVLAKVLHTSTQTIYNWRLGRYSPSPEVLERLRTWIGSEDWRKTCCYESEHAPKLGRPAGVIDRKKRDAAYFKWLGRLNAKRQRELREEREARGIISRQSACRKNFEWIAEAEREARPHYKRAFSLTTLYCRTRKNAQTGMFEYHSVCSGRTYTFK